MTFSELHNLLENAGFSHSNPYSVIRQGKVTELSICGDRKRLEVIRELSGVETYDESRREAHRDLEQAEEEMDEVRQRMESLETHMQELTEDNQLLAKYNEIEK